MYIQLEKLVGTINFFFFLLSFVSSYLLDKKLSESSDQGRPGSHTIIAKTKIMTKRSIAYFA